MDRWDTPKEPPSHTHMETWHTELGVCRAVFQLPSNQVTGDIACRLFRISFWENPIEFNAVSRKNLQDPMGYSSPQNSESGTSLSGNGSLEGALDEDLWTLSKRVYHS